MENEQKIEAIPKPIYKNGLLTCVEYLNFKIEVKSFNVHGNSTKSEIGGVIENYRKKNTLNFADKQKVIDDFLENTGYPFSAFTPDYLQVIASSDEERKALIHRFSDKLLDGKNLKSVDFSKSFTKIKNDSAAKKSREEVNKMWTYEKPNGINVPAKNVLIIDDIIDSGNTICAFIDKLIEKEVINNQTIIKAIIIYNNYKDPNFKPFSLKDYKAISK